MARAQSPHSRPLRTTTSLGPTATVTLLLYSYSTGQRSSRMIERHCRQDVAYRVITGNVVPDHATIARFVVRHERVLAESPPGRVIGLGW